MSTEHSTIARIIIMFHIYYPFFVDIQEKEITKVCSWKFQHYDKDNDESLSSSDQQNFYEEIYRLIGTKSFEGHFDRLIDTDNNGAISKQEFKDLFNLEEGEIAYIYCQQCLT